MKSQVEVLGNLLVDLCSSTSIFHKSVSDAVAVSDGIIALSTNVLRSRFGKKCSKTIKIWRAEAAHLCGSDKLIFTIFEQKHTTFMFDVTSRHVISEEEKRSFFAGAFLV